MELQPSSFNEQRTQAAGLDCIASPTSPPPSEPLAGLRNGWVDERVGSFWRDRGRKSLGVVSPRTPKQSTATPVALAAAGDLPVNHEPRSKAIEFSGWKEKLLNPRIASERDVCIELERTLSPYEKRRWDEFRQYLRSLAGDSAEDEAERQAFRPFHNRTRLSWRVVEIAEDDQPSGSSVGTNDTQKRVPYICIEGVRTRQNAQNLHAFLSKRKARAEYHPPFKLCYSLAHISAPASKHRMRLRQQPSPFTLCGSLVKMTEEGNSGSSTFTIGGLVQIGSEVFALSSRHDLVSEEPTKTEEGMEELVEKLEGCSDLDDDIDPPLILEPDISELDLDPIDQTSPGRQSAGHEESLIEGPQELIGNITHLGTEWCLFSLDDAFQHLANCVDNSLATDESVNVTSRRVYLDKVAAEPVNTAVVAVCGRSGQVNARMSPNATDLFLPSGKIVEVWRISFDRQRKAIRQGDSGSWVVDLDNGVVFGHIIAATSSSAHVLPMKDILKDIDAMVGKSMSCHLVSAFERLADLAMIHSSLSQQQARLYAREALTLDVLTRSERTASVSLLLDYLEESNRAQADLEVLVNLLKFTGSELARCTVNGVARTEARSRTLGDSSVSTRVIEDLEAIMRQNQVYETTHSDKKRGIWPQTSGQYPVSLSERSSSPHKDSADAINSDTLPGTDAWSAFSGSRFNLRPTMFDNFDFGYQLLIRRELHRVAVLRRYFGTYRLAATDKSTVLDMLGTALKAYRETAAARVQRGVSDIRLPEPGWFDRNPRLTKVENWQHTPVQDTHDTNRLGSNNYETPGTPFGSIDSSDYSLDAEYEAALVLWDKGSGGVSSMSEFVRGEFPSQKISLNDLFREHEDPPLKRSTGGDRIQYLHLPANHMGWVERVFSIYYTGAQSGYASNEGVHTPSPWAIQHRDDDPVPLHAQQVTPHCSVSMSMPHNPNDLNLPGSSRSRDVGLFMPYLHWEDKRSLDRARQYVKFAHSQKILEAQTLRSDEGVKGTTTRNSKLSPRESSVPRSQNNHNDTQNAAIEIGWEIQRTPAWKPRLPLAQYLFYAAKVYQLFQEAADAKLVMKDLMAPSPLHLRRTLDPPRKRSIADGSTQQNMENIICRATRQQRDSDPGGKNLLTSRIVVDQLWLWILDDNTIISSFPKNWGCRLGDAPSDVYSSISHRVGALTPAEVTSVHDIALVIIEECSKAMFGQCAARGSLTGMGGLYGYSLSEIASRTSIAYKSLGDIMSLDLKEVSSLERALPNLQQSSESSDYNEVHQAINLLQSMQNVFSQQIPIVKEYKLVLNQLSNEVKASTKETGHDLIKTSEKVTAMINDMGHRRSELEDMAYLYKGTQNKLRDLQRLRQQIQLFNAISSRDMTQYSLWQQKAISIFTAVTVIFLPISFGTSFFGLNANSYMNISFSGATFLIFAISSTLITLALLITFSAGFRRLLSLTDPILFPGWETQNRRQMSPLGVTNDIIEWPAADSSKPKPKWRSTLDNASGTFGLRKRKGG